MFGIDLNHGLRYRNKVILTFVAKPSAECKVADSLPAAPSPSIMTCSDDTLEVFTPSQWAQPSNSVHILEDFRKASPCFCPVMNEDGQAEQGGEDQKKNAPKPEGMHTSATLALPCAFPQHPCFNHFVYSQALMRQRAQPTFTVWRLPRSPEIARKGSRGFRPLRSGHKNVLRPGSTKLYS